ncbi:MAG: ParA family protein [Alphaproteobacteria bacterium]|nr:ParA family protein [Alphaproteobacteria bacterium]
MSRTLLSVLVGNIKGGCGKTTIATHLAAAFAMAGYRTQLSDADHQRSSLGWLRRRPVSLPVITGADWSKELGEPEPGIERLVIDAPAAMRHKAAAELIAVADIVVVPVLPSAFDQEATGRFLAKLGEIKAVRKNKRTIAIVGNRLRPGTKASEQLDTFLGQLGYQVVTRLRDTQLYPAAAAAGSSVFEDKGRRGAEYVKEWEALLALLGLGER